MSYSLRPYQQKAIDMFLQSSDKAPCIVVPTGGGKSIIVAYLIKALANKRILLLTHQKELIEQDVAKINSVLPEINVGVYSASIGSKDFGDNVTAASIQSLYRYKGDLYYDYVIIDEAHLINNDKKGMYRKLLEKINNTNPSLRVIGLTATPYRLGQGMVTDGDLFTSILEPVSIRQLIANGYLAKLTSKDTKTHYDLTKVGIRGGEFIESELQDAVSSITTNEELVDELISRAEGRKHWLIFCCGVNHAQQISSLLNEKGINSNYIVGSMAKKEREAILNDFVTGKIKALCNAKILTTGFDFPDIDMIALLQPTLSPGLYMQEIGRGLRVKSDKGNCLILDFAGNVMRHGPVEQVEPPKKKKKGKGVAPAKSCPCCSEILATSVKVCPICGYEFPKKDNDWELSNTSVTELESETKLIEVRGWNWFCNYSKAGNRQIVIAYRPKNLTAKPIMEYLQITRNDWKGTVDRDRLFNILNHFDVKYESKQVVDTHLCDVMNNAKSPYMIGYYMEKKYPKVIYRNWSDKYAITL